MVNRESVYEPLSVSASSWCNEIAVKSPLILLKVSGLAKSVYYYTLSKIDKDDKNKEIIVKIKEVFINNKERFFLDTNLLA